MTYFNESLFLFHIFALIASLIVALRMSKEALILYAAAQWLFANIFILKQITLLGLTVPPSDVFTISGTLAFNFLYKEYGKETASRTVQGVFLLLGIFALSMHLYILYIPSRFDVAHPHFQTLFSTSGRIITASLIAYGISQWLNIVLVSILKKAFSSWQTINFISLSISQAVDTILFTYLGLNGLMHSLIHVAALSFSIKFITIILSLITLRFFTFIRK